MRHRGGIPVPPSPTVAGHPEQGLSTLLFWLRDLQQGMAEVVFDLASALPLCGKTATGLPLCRDNPS
ncbi:hypothetical protein [Citrobacter koseri]|uniref:hypothetical protein n=1 Tax=Citrobacter koseri TaxID=545 RepID=UPI0011587191|nr:hypothetical protein [Citrobacter koseri]